jgi:hypothetical protein
MGIWRRGKSKLIGHDSNLQVVLQGGLGNQLFQFANGVARSIHLDSTILFSDSSLKTDSQRNFALGYFDLKPNQLYKSGIFQDVLTFKTLSPQVIDQVEKVIEEKFHFTLTDQMLEKGRNYAFFGYWQSNLNFLKIESFLRDFLLNSLPECQANNSSVMHIRRGDFLGNKKTREYHGILSFDYYSRAINLLDIKNQDIHIVSDDFDHIGDLIARLESVFGKRFVVRHDLSDEVDALALMVGSQKLIMANSSFSWWGAYLSKADKIIAPRNFFSRTTQRELNTCDLYPEGWTLT